MSFRGGGGAGGGKNVPFDVDAATEDQLAAYKHNLTANDDDWEKVLYPDNPKGMHMPQPPTAHEKRLVANFRKHRHNMRTGPMFSATPKADKRDPAEFNAFEDVATFSNKRTKLNEGWPDMTKVPLVKELIPEELWDIYGDQAEDGDGTTAPKKSLDFLKKKRLDRLAKFDENADTVPAGDDDSDNEAADDEDQVELPQDDDFSEDDDDLGNDYNAEKYFDDGDGVDDDGDDAGGDDACSEPAGDRANGRVAAYNEDDYNDVYTKTQNTWKSGTRNPKELYREPFRTRDASVDFSNGKEPLVKRLRKLEKDRWQEAVKVRNFKRQWRRDAKEQDVSSDEGEVYDPNEKEEEPVAPKPYRRRSPKNKGNYRAS